MNKCAIEGCPESPTQGSAFCFLHWFDAHGGLMDAEKVAYPAPVQPPHEVHGQLMREMRMRAFQADSQEAEEESAS